MTGNPFRPAEQVVPKVKCLVYGLSGVGKTYLALTAPGRVAVIDTEGGTAFYANRRGLSGFDVLPTKTFNDVTRAIAYLASHPGEYETLVIDPVTVLYETLQDAAQMRRASKRNNADADLEMLDWQQIKRAYKTLMTDLVNLPLHVIVTARERDDTERKGNDSVKVGVRPDAEKSTPYYFDTVVRLTAKGQDREAHVEKDRTGTLPATVPGPTFEKLFAKAIKAGKGATADRALPSDDEAAARDAETTFSDNAAIRPDTDGGLIGTIATQGTQDFQLRIGPEQSSIPFRLKEGRGSVIVAAHGELAEALADLRPSPVGVRVKAWGSFDEESYEKRDAATGEMRRITYQVLHATRIQGPGFDLPAPKPVSDPVAPGQVSAFDEAEAAAIAAAVDAAPAEVA